MIEHNVLVSVIIPNYNHGSYLADRIESVLSQTYQNMEVIILDDCSTDNSRAVIEQYRSESRIADVIYNEINTGSPFKQWVKGIEKARGEIIWLAESDDWCEPTFLEHVLPSMLADPEVAVSYCQSYCVIDNDIKWQSNHKQLVETVDGYKFIAEYLTPNPAIFNASMAIWRKRNFTYIAKDFLNYRFSGDWLFWIELAKTGKVSINGRLLNYFRKHRNDVSTGSYQTGLNFVEGMSILQHCADNKLIDERKFKLSVKKNIKEYWPIKSQFARERQLEIERLFQTAPSSKSFFLKCVSSAVWKSFKSK